VERRLDLLADLLEGARLDGRFSQAFIRPRSSLFGRTLAAAVRLTTRTGISSTVSYEVKRRPHALHSRRRLVTAPSGLAESTTRSSAAAQYGHLTAEA